MENVKEFQSAFETTKKEKERCQAYITRLEIKQESLGERLSALAGELAAKKAEGKNAMAAFVADEIGETELADLQSEVAEVERRYRAAKPLVDAVAAEICQARERLKECEEAVKKAHGRLWDAVAGAEIARARIAGEAVIKRAYLAWRRHCVAGRCLSMREFISETVFSLTHLTDADEAAIKIEIEAEYGVPYL